MYIATSLGGPITARADASLHVMGRMFVELPMDESAYSDII